MNKTERNRQIIELRDKGHTFAEIARKLKTTKGTVAGVCARNGRTNPSATELPATTHLDIFKRCARGESYVSVAKLYGITRNRVGGIYHRHPLAIEADNLDLEICDLLDKGFDNHQICHLLTVSRNQVSAMRNALEKTS